MWRLSKKSAAKMRSFSVMSAQEVMDYEAKGGL